MKFIKRLTALLLSAACVCALVCVPPAGAAPAVSTFPDVTDPQVGRAVEALRTMGIISGSGGKYNPNGNLTRAGFCKLILDVMGKKDEAAAQANRTIFTDVPGKHWARGYVNLAAMTTVGGGEDGKGGTRLVMGMGDGSFAPDRVITYGEAVTVVLRVLDYVKESNVNWPHGAVSTAASVGLTAGFTPPKAGDPITRAQAAMLFCNMLTTPVSGEKDSTYLKSKLNCDVKKGALLLSCNTKTESGLPGAVQVFTKDGGEDQKPVLPAVNTPAAFLEGTRGTAVYDKQGKLLTFLPDAGATSKTITVASASGGVLTATDGTKYTPSPSTKVWDGGKDESYSSKHKAIQSGTSITICFTEAGTIDYLFVHGTSMSLSGGVMVARDKVSGNPFAQLTAGTVDYKIVKNGVEVTTSALKQYDVAAFDPSNKTLYVTDFRLTGVYVSASPNTSMPTKIKLSLIDKELEVLDSAVDDLKNLKLNSAVTLLFSPDGKVAGAVSSSTLRSNTVGYVTSYGDGTVKVKLLNAPHTNDEKLDLSEVSGKFSGKPENYADCLVTVTGTRSGKENTISLSRLSGKTPSGPLDLKNRTLGGVPLADNVAIFDRIASSGIQPTSLAAVAVDSVPASKIAYQRTNAAGEVDLLVLNDVTGDLYTYGICKNGWTQPVSEATSKTEDGTPGTPSDNPSGGGSSLDKPNNRTTMVLNASHPTKESPALTVVGGTTYKDNQFIGLAASVNELDNTPRHAASVALKSVEKVSPANFNLNTGLFFSGSVELPIADDVQCYNAQTKTWFGENDTNSSPMDNLNACLAYSSSLTVYYDRDPGQGGKVRIVVAN